MNTEHWLVFFYEQGEDDLQIMQYWGMKMLIHEHVATKCQN